MDLAPFMLLVSKTEQFRDFPGSFVIIVIASVEKIPRWSSRLCILFMLSLTHSYDVSVNQTDIDYENSEIMGILLV